MRRIPGVSQELIFWTSGYLYFYLADQSIAETEDRGEEEESDERTPPACLVDDDGNDPAGHLHQSPENV